MFYIDCHSSIDDTYQIYCENLVRYFFVDNYLRSVEYYRLAVQHRIGYIVDCLHLDRKFAKTHLNSLYGIIAYKESDNNA